MTLAKFQPGDITEEMLDKCISMNKLEELIAKRQKRIDDYNGPVYSMVEEWMEDLQSLSLSEPPTDRGEIYSFKQLKGDLRNDFIYLREKMSDIKFGISEANAEAMIIKCIGKHINKLSLSLSEPPAESKVEQIAPKRREVVEDLKSLKHTKVRVCPVCKNPMMCICASDNC